MLLADQGGDLYFQKMILVVICFVIGGLILSSLYAVFDSSFADRLSEIFEQILTVTNILDMKTPFDVGLSTFLKTSLYRYVYSTLCLLQTENYIAVCTMGVTVLYYSDWTCIYLLSNL